MASIGFSLGFEVLRGGGWRHSQPCSIQQFQIIHVRTPRLNRVFTVGDAESGTAFAEGCLPLFYGKSEILPPYNAQICQRIFDGLPFRSKSWRNSLNTIEDCAFCRLYPFQELFTWDHRMKEIDQVLHSKELELSQVEI